MQEEIDNKIREAFYGTGLTVARIAERAAVSYPKLYRLINEKSDVRMSIDEYNRVLVALKLNPISHV